MLADTRTSLPPPPGAAGPGFEIQAYLGPPLYLPVEGGGSLSLNTTRAKLTLSTRRIPTTEDSSDVLQLIKSIADDKGQAYRFTTTISADDLWDAISDEPAYLEEAYLASYHHPKGTELVPLAEGLDLRIDDRDIRVFGVVTEPTGPLHLFQVHEKYLSGKVDLLLKRPAPFPNGFKPAESFVARFHIQKDIRDATEEFEITPKHTLMIPIRPNLILWENYWRLTVVDSETPPCWNRASLPEPIVAVRIDTKGEAQQGVSYER